MTTRKIYFDPTISGWLFSDIHDAEVCAGNHEVSQEEYDALMAKEATGKYALKCNRKGAPELVLQTTAISKDDAEQMAISRKNYLLFNSDWTQLADTLLKDKPLKKQWAQYRQKLREIDLSNPDWPAAPGAGENEEEE